MDMLNYVLKRELRIAQQSKHGQFVKMSVIVPDLACCISTGKVNILDVTHVAKVFL